MNTHKCSYHVVCEPINAGGGGLLLKMNDPPVYVVDSVSHSVVVVMVVE